MKAVGGLTAKRASALSGEAAAPGDKSISHRALILGALARGETTATGLLEGHDVLRTAAAMRALGAEIERDLTDSGPLWRIRGGDWRDPGHPLFFGNSGTGCRLALGASGRTRRRGDLRRRPESAKPADGARHRAARPHGRDNRDARRTASGAAFARHRQRDRIPAPRRLGASEIRDPSRSARRARNDDHHRADADARSHRAHACSFRRDARRRGRDGAGRRIAIGGGQDLKPSHVVVAGDPSSAAFLAAAAAVAPGSDILIRNVLVNPLRAGFYETLKEMGGRVEFVNPRTVCGEPVADIRVRHAPLKGVTVPASRAASMIDEYPVLAVVAAFASGEDAYARRRGASRQGKRPSRGDRGGS